MTITFRREGAIGILSLDRPAKLNAMSHEMGDAIHALVDELNGDPTLRCLLVRGEGRAFSAGGDLDFLEKNAAQDPDANRDEMLAFYTKFLAIRELEVPTIALLHGRATGAGLCFALGCDLRVAAEDAMLSVNFARIGLTPGMGGTWSLQRVVGPARAAELLYTGRTVTGTEAATMGLVNLAVPADVLEARGLALANEIAAAAPVAIRLTKGLLRDHADVSLAEALEAEAAAQALVFASADLKEGVASIREKRTPTYEGR
ncbi:MAG: enoyl-CoA hydratase [Cyanobacteria bacterium RYN_339]|nr:enoyl-CoA hydratase [Cyanobacteria bacterium RYN_339]